MFELTPPILWKRNSFSTPNRFIWDISPKHLLCGKLHLPSPPSNPPNQSRSCRAASESATTRKMEKATERPKAVKSAWPGTRQKQGCTKLSERLVELSNRAELWENFPEDKGRRVKRVEEATNFKSWVEMKLSGWSDGSDVCIVVDMYLYAGLSIGS